VTGPPGAIPRPPSAVSAVLKLSSPATREFWEIPVLFEDDDLLALDKPAGLLTSPDRYDPERPNLMKLLHRGIAEHKPWAAERALTYLMNAHRLDFETSGVLLLAKNKPALVRLADLFGSEKPGKRYVALAHGQPKADRFEIDAKLAPNPMRPGRMRVDPRRGKRARTLVEVKERFSGFALLQCEPLTGRTHQIRVHLRHVGLPLVADACYGGAALFLSRLKRDYRPKQDAAEPPLIGRVALHAEALRLPHPVSGRPLAIHAPWPKDLRVAVKYLRRYSRGSESRMEGVA
jgi:RluA family pseudouridine synthase